MTDMTRITIPDIGDFDEVEVIEVLINIGDLVAIEDPVITLESDKATMEIPSPANGTVTSIAISVGDRVGEGALVAEITDDEGQPPPESASGEDKKNDEAARSVTPRPARQDSSRDEIQDQPEIQPGSHPFSLKIFQRPCLMRARVFDDLRGNSVRI